jgi:hypothetical protein
MEPACSALRPLLGKCCGLPDAGSVGRLSENFAGMPAPAGLRRDIAPVMSLLGQAEAAEPLEARTVLQSGRPAQRAAENQPVQGGAATGFKVGLAPHSNFLWAESTPWQEHRPRLS